MTPASGRAQAAAGAVVHAVMCGGMGTRLWPLSNEATPKPFLGLFGGRSLLQATVARLAADGLTTIVIGNAAHGPLIGEQLAAVDADIAAVILEPLARNTAAAGIVAALWALRFGPRGVRVLLSPADHHIADEAGFRAAVAAALGARLGGRVLAFGVRPDRPETGYGYIEAGAPADAGEGVLAMRAFHEKPDAATAARYVATGRHLWNAGLFLFEAGSLAGLAGELVPGLAGACRAALDGAVGEDRTLRLDAAAYADIEAGSFDRAIMDRIGDRGLVLPMEAGWSDVGSWEALYRLAAPGP